MRTLLSKQNNNNQTTHQSKTGPCAFGGVQKTIAGGTEEVACKWIPVRPPRVSASKGAVPFNFFNNIRVLMIKKKREQKTTGKRNSYK